MANLSATKPLNSLMREAEETGEHCLKRTLGPVNLTMLGIGAIIAAGLFVRTAAAIADRSGPSVTLAFIVAGIGCAFAYSYATMGEFVAWIIGWDLCLEYAVGAATVSIAWSEYFNRVLGWFGLQIPYAWCHSPLQTMGGIRGIINLPAIFILLLLTMLLIKGTKESAMVNGFIVVLKVAIVILVIALGWGFINPANHTPFIPPPSIYVTPEGITHHFGGIMGILGAAGVVFFAFIGFDAVSTAAQEARKPERDMPIGILGSLVICTVLYVLFAYVLSGVATVQDFRSTGREASVAFAITKYMHGYEWLSKSVTVAILAGFSSVILVMLLGQTRVFYSMSKDGLVPKVFSDVHPRFRTPYKSNMLFFVFTGLFAGFLPEDIVGEMTSIGTLFAFILVCIGVWILRARRPDLPRAFKVRALPLVSILGVLVCGAMIFGLGWTNWLRLIVWLAIGLVFYFTYGIKNSKVQAMQSAGK